MAFINSFYFKKATHIHGQLFHFLTKLIKSVQAHAQSDAISTGSGIFLNQFFDQCGLVVCVLHDISFNKYRWSYAQGRMAKGMHWLHDISVYAILLNNNF